jgi:hypothetical protein
MKKVMFGLAAAAAISAFAIESANTVGYITQSLGTDEYVHTVGVSFKECGVAGGAYTVGTTIFSADAVGGDMIYVFDPNNWDLSGYTFNGFDGETSLGWYYLGADGTEATVASFTVEKGEVVYFQPADAMSDATVSGEVESGTSASVTFDLTSGDYVFPLVNPFPIDTTLGDLETFAASGDMIYVFDADNWDLSGYTFNGFEGGVSAGWYYLGADGTEDTITNSSTVVLPAGQGAFFQPNATCTWTVTLQ